MNKARLMKQVAGAVAVVAALGSLQATAGTLDETLVKSKAVRSETVSYDDLDLSSAAGQESLYYRVSGAARRVCGSSDPRITGHVGTAADNRACYRRAMDDAMGQVNAGQVAVISK